MADILIEDLKKEHGLITDLLKAIKEVGIGSKEGKDKFLAAKKGLLAHLKKEDEKLYPVLRKAAETDRDLKLTLDYFARDMQEVTRITLEFFDKYAKTEASGLEFAKDFGKLIAVLGSRVRKEENALYPGYEKIINDKAS